MSELNLENGKNESPARFKNKLLISIVISLVIFIGLAIYADIGEVGKAFTQFRWKYIPLILALTLLNYLLRFFKWEYYLRNLEIRVKPVDSLLIFVSGLTMSITPARLGEVFKSFLLNKLNGTEISRSVPVIITERITDVLGLSILAAITFSSFRYGLGILIGILVFLILLILIIKSRRVSHKLLDFTKSTPLIKRVSESLRTSYETAHALFRLKQLAVALAISVISWGCECLAMYYVLQGFGLDISIQLSTFVFAFSSLAGAISMIPGGLVMAEGSMTGLLVLAEAPMGVAASATIMIRVCTLWFGIAMGLIAMFLIRNKVFRNQRQE